MGIDHGGLDVPSTRLRASFVAEEFLNGTNIVTVLQQAGGEAVTEGMGGNGFVNFGELSSLPNCFSLAPPARAGV
jgi:hypothetical protein